MRKHIVKPYKRYDIECLHLACQGFNCDCKGLAINIKGKRVLKMCRAINKTSCNKRIKKLSELQLYILQFLSIETMNRELIRQIHPDRFTEEKKQLTTELAAQVTAAKHNYRELNNIKAQIEKLLN